MRAHEIRRIGPATYRSAQGNKSIYSFMLARQRLRICEAPVAASRSAWCEGRIRWLHALLCEVPIFWVIPTPITITPS